MGILKKYKGNRFVKNFVIYLASGGISKIIPMLILIIIAKFLSPKEFGLVSNFGVIVNLFGAFSIMKLGKIVQAEYYQQTDTERKTHIANLIYLISILTSALIFISIFLESFFLKTLRLELKWVIVGALVGLFMNIFDIRTIVLRMEEKPKQFAYFQIGNSIITAVLNVIFIVVLKWSWEGRILATFTASLVMFLLTLFFFYQQNWFPQRFSLVIVKRYLYLGIPLLPLAIAPFINSNIAKIILTTKIGLSANGIFSFGVTITMMVQLLVVAYFNTYVPVLYKKLSENGSNSKKIIMKDLKNAIPYLVLIFFIMYVISYFFVINFFNEKYGEIVQYLPLFFIRLFLFAIFSFLNYYLLYLKRIKFISTLAISSAILNATLSYFLIPKFEIFGAVIALVVLLFFKVVFSYTYINRLSRISN